MTAHRLDPARLIGDAIDQAGSDDFGEAGWEEGLDRLADSLQLEGRLSELGVEVAAGDLTGYLVNRLRLTAWRTAHPEVADEGIDQPVIVVGQPRTGTTILFDLLAQDPALRAPLTWEVDQPVPPPEPATYDTDPRIEVSDATLQMADLLIPGFTDFHPLGARLGQECVRITAGDFKSMIFGTQYRVPTYNRWLLDEADLTSAYRYHRRYLQHLQSGGVRGQWLLKSPAHLWHLDALAAEYPDAVVVQTHRDPLKVIASVSALVAHLRRMASDETSVEETAAEYADDIFVGLDRGIGARERGVFPEGQEVDVHFADFVADPLATIARLYTAMGRNLTDEAADAMRAFLAANPGDGGGGGTRYRWADTGLDADVERARAKRYQEVCHVASEPVR